MLDGCVVVDAVASPSTSAAVGSDVDAISVPPSSCIYGRSSRCVSVRLESNAPSDLPLTWVLTVDEITIAQAAVVAPSLYVGWNRSKSGCLRGSCPGDFPDNFHLEVLDHRHG